MSGLSIQADDLTFNYPCGKPALRGLSLRIERQVRMAIVGPNGSGKSTLLQCLNGVLRPQRGTIRLNEQPMTYDRAVLRDWRRRVGLLFQDPDDQVVAPSVIQDVAFGPLNLDRSAIEARDRALAALASLGIEHLAESGTHELSHGQKKRVALAGVLAMHPDIILLDEPTAGLDPLGTRQLFDELDRLHSEGVTIVIASHNLDMVYAWADQTAILGDGITLGQGNTLEMLRDSALLESAKLEKPSIATITERFQKNGLLSNIADIRTTAGLVDAVDRTMRDRVTEPRHPGSSTAGQPNHILLVAFGTSVPEAETAYQAIERRCRERFPDSTIAWAFTSRRIRAKMAAAGRTLDSPADALKRLFDDGATNIAVQSLHVIRGQEYDRLAADLKQINDHDPRRHKVAMGLPLLSSTADIERVARIMNDCLVPAERRAEDAVVWMGHGSSDHAQDSMYDALATALRRLDPHSFLGTVEGRIDWHAIAGELLCHGGARRAWLLPFMAVAGDHARNDLAGDDGDSWQSRLEAEGFECHPVLRGIAESDAVTDIWFDHLEAALQRPTA